MMARIPGVFMQEDHLQHVVEIRRTGFSLLELTFPDDVTFDLKTGGAFFRLGQVSPADAYYKVGDTIDPADRYGGDESAFMFEVLFDADNPIAGAAGGFWKNDLELENPYDFTADIPTFDVVDIITPNRFHDSDQAIADEWTASGKAQATALYNTGISDNATFLANWESVNADQITRLRTVSAVADVDPYGAYSSFGDRAYTVNVAPFIFYSGEVSYVEMGSELLSADPQLFYENVEFALGSYLSGGLNFVDAKPITVTIGDIWHVISRNRKTYLLDLAKMGDTKVDLVLSKLTADRTGTVTTGAAIYKVRAGSSFVAEADRKVQSNISDADALIKEGLDCQSVNNVVLFSFDKDGFI